MKRILYLLIIVLTIMSCKDFNVDTANEFTTKNLTEKPTQSDMTGIWEVDKFSYELNEKKGYEKKKILLNLKKDGTFEITNLPNYINVFDETKKRFVNTNGTWQIKKEIKGEKWVLNMRFDKSSLYENGMSTSYDIYLQDNEIIIWNFIGDPDSRERFLYRWLFSFYFAGIRVGDVLKIKWSDIVDGRLQYTMNKNQKVLSLKIPEKVCLILKQYESDKQSQDDLIFPELKKANKTDPKDVFIKTKLANRALNVYLEEIAEKAKINKKLTMHISRHSFGNISGDRIPIQMLQKLYRHSSVTTTINYQANFMQKDVDEALEKVINF